MQQNQDIRKLAADSKAEALAEKEWWAKKCASAKDSDSEPTSPVKAGSKASDESGVLVEADGPAEVLQQGGGKKKKSKK
jgi:hypothetical protein